MQAELNKLQTWLSTYKEPSIAVCKDSDPHCSEIPAPLYCFRSHLSGFTGSLGTLLVSKTEAHLWTDSRYFAQLKDSDYAPQLTLHCLSEHDSPERWISTTTSEQTQIHFFHESLSELGSYEEVCSPRPCIAHLVYPKDLWRNRPELICNPIRLLRSASLNTVVHTLQTIRNTMKEHACSTHLIASLDDIAYITNLRAADLPYQQLFHAFLIIQDESAQLFLRDLSQLTVEAAQLLTSASIEVRAYTSIEDVLNAIPEDQPLLLDPKYIDAGMFSHFTMPTVFGAQPSTLLKAVKSATELENIQEAYRIDSRAFFRTIHAIKKANHRALTESAVAQYCREYRSLEKSYLGESFAPICASGPHAAIPHYNTQAHSTKLLNNTVLLIDSGGQYETGTTDVTRTLAIGDVPEHIKNDYTLVLKAHVHLSALTFPAGTRGRDLDAICKAVLWNFKRDFQHGTGHGVGYATTVHEFPPSISSKNESLIQSGMVFSVEPGIYIEGSHGIRIENIVYVAHSGHGASGEFYCLHPLTFCPYERDLILIDLLSSEEREWINAYHARVYEELSSGLNADERRQLQIMTAPL